jgi:hypothetical protein
MHLRCEHVDRVKIFIEYGRCCGWEREDLWMTTIVTARARVCRDRAASGAHSAGKGARLMTHPTAERTGLSNRSSPLIELY